MKSVQTSLGSREPVFTREFLEGVLGADWRSGSCFKGASGFSIDSRKLEEGDIFVALATEKQDGHDYLSEAEGKGASAALVSKPNEQLSLPQIVVEDPLQALQELGAAWRQKWRGRVIGVTGSCGKTSTKELLGLLLGKDGIFVSLGNLNNHIGVPLSELMLRAEHRIAVLEAGINEGGEMDLLASLLDPNVSVVTTIGPSHLEKLGSLEGIAREKMQLAKHAKERVFLGPACIDYEAFLEGEFASTRWLLPISRTLSRTPEGVIWRYGILEDPKDGTSSVRLRNGTLFEFPTPDATAGMVENICLALLVASEEGVAQEDLLKRLSLWKAASQRGEIIEVGSRTVYADYYNANPASFADAANYFHRRFPQVPRIWVIGGMEELGNSSAAWHRRLAGALPVLLGDKIFLVGSITAEMESTLRGRVGEDSIRLADKAEDVIEEVRATEGVLFLKGSRKYQLEKILDSLGRKD